MDGSRCACIDAFEGSDARGHHHRQPEHQARNSFRPETCPVGAARSEGYNAGCAIAAGLERSQAGFSPGLICLFTQTHMPASTAASRACRRRRDPRSGRPDEEDAAAQENHVAPQHHHGATQLGLQRLARLQRSRSPPRQLPPWPCPLRGEAHHGQHCCYLAGARAGRERAANACGSGRRERNLRSHRRATCASTTRAWSTAPLARPAVDRR